MLLIQAAGLALAVKNLSGLRHLPDLPKGHGMRGNICQNQTGVQDSLLSDVDAFARISPLHKESINK